MRSRLGGLGCGELSPYDCWAYAQTYLRGRTLLILARYNTFYVLYPIGITSECTLIYQALGPAASIDPLFRYFLIAVLVIYVPGMFHYSRCDAKLRNPVSDLRFYRLLCAVHAHDCSAPEGPPWEEAG